MKAYIFKRIIDTMMKNAIILFVVATICCSSCKKYLDAKPDQRMAIPETINDCQLILDSYGTMNNAFPTGTEMQSDMYYLTTANISALVEFDRNMHLWEKFEIVDNSNWAYKPIYTANIALDALSKIKTAPDEQQAANNVKGSGLFFRAYYMHATAQLFAPVYVQNTANTDLGIPIRLDPDFSKVSTRPSLAETYNQIIKDLKASIGLLPLTPLIKTRPSKPAAYGALARVYLSMQDYEQAGLYADSCLQLSSELMDFSTLSTTAAAPIARFNKEVVFHIRSINSSILAPARAKIDSTLYRSYAANDLRKVIYFKANTGANAGTFNFKGDYDGSGTASGYVFGGIVTDEMYLIRAEAYARNGSTTLAMQDLNTLMKTRWKKDVFVPFSPTDANSALKLILEERRKELFYRGTRWTDLRRLMNDQVYTVTPKRIYNNSVYELPPNSPRYLMLIPTDVIRLSGMQQNP